MEKMTQITFTKMHGLGNDFVVIDNRHQHYHFTADQFKILADRHFGIGCDQILFIEKSKLESIDFKYRIFNADGSEVEQCGNGARCFARYVTEKGLTDKEILAVETLSGIIYLYLETSADKLVQVRVNMGSPNFLPEKLPFITDDKRAIDKNNYHLLLSSHKNINFSAVSMGNPHITILTDQLELMDIKGISDDIRKQNIFPKGVNVGFMEILDRDTIKLRVYERGAGETLACGSGACAAVANGIQQGILNHLVKVQLTVGDLTINWDGDINQAVWMSGPASFVFEGKIEI